MSVHVAILKAPYLNMLLAGTKRIECRLAKNAAAPYRRVRPGEVIYFKESGGGYAAKGVAGEVRFYHGLTAVHHKQLRARMNREIGGNDAYWSSKARRGYGTLVVVTRLIPVDRGPSIAASHGAAWFVLPDSAAV